MVDLTLRWKYTMSMIIIILYNPWVSWYYFWRPCVIWYSSWHLSIMILVLTPEYHNTTPDSPEYQDVPPDTWVSWHYSLPLSIIIILLLSLSIIIILQTPLSIMILLQNPWVSWVSYILICIPLSIMIILLTPEYHDNTPYPWVSRQYSWHPWVSGFYSWC